MGTSNKNSCKTAAVMNLLGRGSATPDREVRVLPDQHRDIDVITREILDAKRTGGEAILTIGRGLMEAKAQLSHGEWLPWLEEKVEFSVSAANRFMRLAREWTNSSALTNLGATKALQLLALPESEREKFIDEVHQVNGEEKAVIDMTSRELEAAIRERDQALKAAEQARTDQTAAELARQKMEQDMVMAKQLLEAAQKERDSAFQDAQNRQEAFQASEREVSRLEKELAELRSRPVEVAVQVDEAAVAAARKEAEAAMQAKLDKAKKAQIEAEKAQKAAEGAKTAAQEELDRVKAEAQAIREQAAKAEKKAAITANEDLVLFRTLFDQTQEMTNKLAGVLLKFRGKDPEKAQGLSKALLALSEKIKGVAQG